MKQNTAQKPNTNKTTTNGKAPTDIQKFGDSPQVSMLRQVTAFLELS